MHSTASAIQAACIARLNRWGPAESYFRSRIADRIEYWANEVRWYYRPFQLTWQKLVWQDVFTGEFAPVFQSNPVIAKVYISRFKTLEVWCDRQGSFTAVVRDELRPAPFSFGELNYLAREVDALTAACCAENYLKEHPTWYP